MSVWALKKGRMSAEGPVVNQTQITCSTIRNRTWQLESLGTYCSILKTWRWEDLGTWRQSEPESTSSLYVDKTSHSDKDKATENYYYWWPCFIYLQVPQSWLHLTSWLPASCLWQETTTLETPPTRQHRQNRYRRECTVQLLVKD